MKKLWNNIKKVAAVFAAIGGIAWLVYAWGDGYLLVDKLLGWAGGWAVTTAYTLAGIGGAVFIKELVD